MVHKQGAPHSAVRLIEEIKPMGYQGSLVVLRRYLKTLKHDAQVIRSNAPSTGKP